MIRLTLILSLFVPLFAAAQIPAASPADQQKLYGEMLDGGKAKVLEAVAKLPDNEGAYALEGMARAALSPGAKPAWRSDFEAAILESLAAAPSPYLLKMLHWAGTEKSVPALGGLLANETLADPALRALQTIGGDAAAAAVRDSLPKVNGRVKIGHMLVLAALRDTKATDALMKASADPNHGAHALQALAAIGDPKAKATIMGALNIDDRTTGQALALRYAERLNEGGHAASAASIFRQLHKDHPEAKFGHVQARALSGLVAVEGGKALPDLLASFDGPSLYVQARAAELMAGLEGGGVSQAASEKLAKASPAAKALLLDCLASRGDKVAAEAIVRTMKDSDESVVQAAMDAATRMGGDAAVSALGAAVLGGQVAAADQLARVASPDAIAAMYGQATTPAAKSGLLNALEGAGAQGHMKTILTALADSDAAVQKTAAAVGKSAAQPGDLNALLKVYQGADEAQKRRVLGLMQAGARREADANKRHGLLSNLYKSSNESGLIPLLAASGSDQVVPTLAGIATGDNKDASMAAVQQLVKSQDGGAKDALMRVAAKYKDDRNKVAVNRLLQITGVESADQLAEMATLPAHKAVLKERQSVATLRQIKGWADVSKLADHWTGEIKDVKEANGELQLGKTQGNLISKKAYTDFVFDFQFKLGVACNNGVGIRVPAGGHPSKDGMEIQILDDTAKKYAKLEPTQYHGSLYKIAAAKKGHLKPVGEWNHQTILCIGSHVKVVLNDQVILDTYLDKLDPALIKAHKGVSSKSGHIVFCAHGEPIQFRRLKIKDYSVAKPNEVPNKQSGFKELFNGKDLQGWQGLVGNPKTRASMSADDLALKQQEADQLAARHWKAENGVLVFDGRGQNLCSAEDFEDFDLVVDWKIEKNGDSGIYLRGSPQVSIWDPENEKQFKQGCDKGSGALWNNKKHERFPKERADKPAGEWNRFFIRMVNDRVNIWLNGKHVTESVVLENYWEREQAIYRSGPIELQNHGNRLYFDNIWVRTLPN